MRNGLRGVAQEISYDLVREIGSHRPMKKSTTGGVIDLLLDQLAEEVVSELTADLKAGTATHVLEARLETLEKKLNQLASTHSDEGDDEEDGRESRLPNLKYAKPKYKDVQSILKYIESEQDQGGVKLVIMNFND